MRLRVHQHQLHARHRLLLRLGATSICLVVLQEALRALLHSPLCSLPRAPPPRLRPLQGVLVGPDGAQSSSRGKHCGSSSLTRNMKVVVGLSSTPILAFAVSDEIAKSLVFDSTRG